MCGDTVGCDQRPVGLASCPWCARNAGRVEERGEGGEWQLRVAWAESTWWVADGRRGGLLGQTTSAHAAAKSPELWTACEGSHRLRHGAVSLSTSPCSTPPCPQPSLLRAQQQHAVQYWFSPEPCLEDGPPGLGSGARTQGPHANNHADPQHATPQPPIWPQTLQSNTRLPPTAAAHSQLLPSTPKPLYTQAFGTPNSQCSTERGVGALRMDFHALGLATAAGPRPYRPP